MVTSHSQKDRRARQLILIVFPFLGFCVVSVSVINQFPLFDCKQRPGTDRPVAPPYSSESEDKDSSASGKQGRAYRHQNFLLPPANQCTKEQQSTIYRQLNMSNGAVNGFTCQDTDWLNAFFEDEEDVGTEFFVGISVGCNKGTDAIATARMGLMNPKFDVSTWKDALGVWEYYCPPQKQGTISFPPREGEMHCIEPMLSTFQAVKEASIKLELDAAQFVISHAAISSRDGNVEFPNTKAGLESCGFHGCQGAIGVTSSVEVQMYSLDSYVENFVKSKGPINILNVDAEGWDFDVLFGASTVLDRTYYIEFEYHIQGKWVNYHLLDAVRLLDGKGFTCYWTSRTHLWRITECYFDLYETWHGWSNVGCVHRSFIKLATRMEDRFLSTLNDLSIGQ